MSHWILIEAQDPARFEHVVIGPFDTEERATEHVQDSLQVQGMCDDDAIDAWAVDCEATKDATTAAWRAAAENWGRYRAVYDAQSAAVRCASPVIVGASGAGPAAAPAPARGVHQ